MPYKDPERKRQWEREHREERNARRRTGAASPDQQSVQATIPDPIPREQEQMLATFFGLALACAFVAAVWLTNRENANTLPQQQLIESP